MKIAIVMCIVGMFVGIWVSSMIYGYQAKQEGRELGIRKLMQTGFSEDEARSTYDRMYVVSVNYWNLQHIPWVLAGVLCGGVGGTVLGAIIASICQRRDTSQVSQQPN